MPSYSSYNLNELFSLMKKSDQVAFNEVYNRTWKQLFTTAKSKLNDEQLAQEVVQDIFIDLWEKKLDREIKNIPAYLNQMLRFKVIDIYRSKKLLTEDIDNIKDVLLESSSSEDRYLENELELILNNWISKLPSKRKIIFELYYWDNKSTKEISDLLNLSTKTVQNQLLLSKISLKDILQKIFLLFFIFFLGVRPSLYDYMDNHEVITILCQEKTIGFKN